VPLSTPYVRHRLALLREQATELHDTLIALAQENAENRDSVATASGFVGAVVSPHHAALARLAVRR
jgi:hypothetical protein